MSYIITIENQVKMNDVFKLLAEAGDVYIREGATLNAPLLILK